MIFDYLRNIQSKGFFPKNILDIGANVGNFSMSCKRELWPFANYYLIEANEECKLPLMMTGMPYFINLLSDEDNKILTFYKTKNVVACTGNSVYKEKTIHYDQEHVIEQKKKTITDDTLFKDKNIKFDFAKLDTQGSELDILKGAKKTLATCKCILIEVSLKYYNDGIPLKDDIINYMRDYYQFPKFDIIEEHKWEQTEPVGDIHYGDIFQQDLMFYK